MKSGELFGLEQAAWPVLVVGPNGAIHSANSAAILVFGEAILSGSPNLASFWLATGAGTPEQFLRSWQKAGGIAIPLRLAAADGATRPWLASICAPEANGQSLLLQL